MPRAAIIQADQSYSFPDYFKLNFAPQDILAYFDATLKRCSLKLPKFDGELDRLVSLNFSAWHNRGHSQSCLRRYEEAILSYEKALLINPDLHVAWYSHGINFVGLGRNKDAIASFKKALEIDPKNQIYKRNLDAVMSHFNTQIQIRPCSLTISS